MMKTISDPIPSLPEPWFERHPEWADLHRMAWSLAAGHIRQTRGIRHMDCAWSRDRNLQWVWDTCFMALYCRYAPDRFPGVESLDLFYGHQREDGYIAMTYDHDSGEDVYPGRINPPLFAWVEWEHYRATGDDSRFPRVIPPIERLMDWIDRNRRNAPHRRLAATDGPEGGRGESADPFQLYYFEDCGSSGMDDSPRTPRLTGAGAFFDWVDLSCQMALSFRCLGRMHSVLGQEQESSRWETRARELGDLINAELWCPRTRFYHDRMLPSNFVASRTIAGFWPMLAEVCPPERVSDLVAHLRDPAAFHSHTPIPSLSADDPNYCPEGTYWRGGVWAPTNYMVIQGLERNGQGTLAHELAVRYLTVLAETRSAVHPDTLWECYHPEASRPGIEPYTRRTVRPDFVGWTGLGPISMLIESVMGICLDAPEQTVHWEVRLTEAHGVRRLRMGTTELELACESRAAVEAPAVVRAACSHPVRLCLCAGGRKQTVPLMAGHAWAGTV